MKNIQSLYPSLICVLFSVTVAFANIEKGQKAPDFNLPVLEGNETVSLSSYKGKVVLVDFWASWCAPCKISMPLLDMLAGKYTDFYILAINVDDEKENAVKFLRELNLSVKALYDSNKQVIEKYNVPEMPTAYLIDQYGIIQYIHSGYKEENIRKLEFALRGLVDKK
jgi:thiol-disulfide isomerase/thioredoxin